MTAKTSIGIVLTSSGLGLLALLAWLPAASEPGRAVDLGTAKWAVWTAPAMERVGKVDPPARRATVDISAARGEYESFQIVVAAGQQGLTGIDLDASDLTGPDNSVIPAAALEFYREHYIEVTSPSPDPHRGNRPLGRGWYPDALIPFGQRISGQSPAVPFDVAPQSNQPFWIDVRVPRNAQPGVYRGSVRVVSEAGEQCIPVSLRVWGFTIPLRPALRSSFGMHDPSLTDRRIHELLLRHRIMPESVNPGDAREFADRFGLNETGLRFWSHSDRNTCAMDQPPLPGQISAALRLYPRDVAVHLYSADEIDPCPNLFETVRNWSANMHAADPRIRNLVTVSPQAGLTDGGGDAGRSAVDIWTLLPKMWETGRQRIEAVQRKGDEVWSYTALVQDSWSPKWEIDFAPINYRIQPGFISQSLGLAGILYWRIDLWTSAPWQDLQGYRIDGNYYPGEGMLVYPAPGAGAVPSMRLKWIRDGVDDFDYVAILKQLGRGEWALQKSREMGADWHTWTRDPAALESVRRQLGDEIERLSSENAK